ncbi:MAG: acylphosphatase [candidate division WOR-3 bacterium]
MKVRSQIFVSGRVQGVFFRDFTRENSLQLNLTGWVRNLPDGRVEVVVEGEKENILQLIERLKQGPPAAKVKEVNVTWQTYRGEFSDFSIRW